MAEVLENIPVQQEVQQDPPSKASKLYQSLVHDGYTKDNLGNEAEFTKALSDPIKAAKIYSGLKNDGYTEDNLGKANDFYSAFNPIEKKNLVSSSNVTAKPLESGLSNTQTVKTGELQTGELYSDSKNGYYQIDDKGNKVYAPEDKSINTPVLDPIDASLQADQLSKATKEIPAISGSSFAMGTGSTTVPDEEKINQSKAQKDAVRAQGYDPDVIAEDFKGLDKNELAAAGISTGHILDQYKNNRQLYDRSIASLNSQISLKKELASKPNGNELMHNVIQAFNNEDVGDYSQQRENVKNVIRIADENGGENKDKIVKDIATNFANVYGKQASNITDIEKDPLAKKGLNNLQVAAQNYLEDTNPKEANKYKAALLDDKDIKDNFEAQLQKQEAGRRLEEIGTRLSKSYAQENLNKLLPDYTALTNKANTEGLTPEEQTHVLQLEQAGKPFADILKNSSVDESSVATRYPKSFYLDANNFAQELVGQKHTGLGWLAAETGKATENTAKGVWDFASEPFRSEQNSNLHQAEILGGAALTDNSAYLKQNNQTSKNFKPELSKPLQSDVDAIKNDNFLSSDEKIKKVSDLLMNRSGEWRRTPIQGGETNIGLSSLMYGVGGLAANLAPFIAGDLLTGGGANAGALRKLTSAFTSAAATGFHDSYVNALNKGSENPYADAIRITAINSAAMAGADAPSAIRKMLGNESAIGKLVSKMDDVGIEAALKERPQALTAFGKSLDAVKGAGKIIGTSALEGAKSGAKMTAFTTGGQIANDAIDNELKAPADYAKQAAIETLKFTILGTGLGSIGKVMNKPSTMSLATVSEAGRNPEPFLRALESMEKDGSITPESAAQVRVNIDKVSKIFKSSPILNNPDLTESAKREYLYNSIVKNDAQEAAKNLPAKQAEKAEKTAQVSDFKNDLILDPKTDKQLNARQDAIEKILEPKTDANGKSIELPESERKLLEAEQEAIADVIKSTIEPIQPIITEPTQQGVKEAIPESPDAVGQGEPKPANAISPKINLSLQSQNDNNAELTKQLPNTLSSTEKQGSIAGGETNAAATAITGAIHKAVEDIGTGSKKISPDQVRQKEETELKKYAEDNGIFIKNNFGEPDHFGNEQDVFVNKDGKTVTKINDNPTHDTWNDFFHKIAIHNSLFPDVAYTLKGFSERDGHFAAVLEQPMITKGETPVKFSEVIEELGKMGFEPSTDAKDFSSSEDYKNKQSSNVFVNKNTGVNISDLHGENVIKGTDGKIHFIDPIITIDKNRKIPTEQPLPTPEVKDNKAEIKKLEVERDAEIEKVSKPDLKLGLVQSKDLVNSKDPVGNKKIHDDIKERYKRIKALIECL